MPHSYPGVPRVEGPETISPGIEVECPPRNTLGNLTKPPCEGSTLPHYEAAEGASLWRLRKNTWTYRSLTVAASMRGPRQSSTFWYSGEEKPLRRPTGGATASFRLPF